MNGLRYFTNDLLQIQKMTLKEYELRIEAQVLKEIDEKKKMALLGMYIARSGITDKDGKFLVQKESDLFDFEKAENTIIVKPILEQEVYDRLTKIRR